MKSRHRKLIGLLILLPAVTLYLLTAATLGERLPDHHLLKTVYYLAAGVAWAVPALWLLRWTNGGASRNGTDAPEKSDQRNRF